MELESHVSVDQPVHQDVLYTYGALPRGETFRYLILEPGEQHDVLRCSLRTSTIVDADYEAISYVWGTEVRDHDIICDGQLIKITQNLHEALTRLRSSESRSLWADSICINQENVHEKTHQLACMSRMYAEACCVLVCMGFDPEGHAPKLASLTYHMRQRFDSELYKFEEKSVWDLIPFPSASDPLLVDERCAALEAFLHLSWLKRGWVIREAGLACECTLLWGYSNFSWTDLMSVAFWLMGRNVHITSMPSSYHHLQIHMDAYWDRHNNTVRNLPQRPHGAQIDYWTILPVVEFWNAKTDTIASSLSWTLQHATDHV
jgi:hypothetical protein